MSLIILTNARYFLYNLSFAQKLTGLPLGKQLLIAAQVTDESFAATSVNTQPLQQMRGALTLHMLIYSTWCLANIAGVLTGELLTPLLTQITSFAIISMFAALLAAQFQQRLREESTRLIIAVGASVATVAGGIAIRHPQTF